MKQDDEEGNVNNLGNYIHLLLSGKKHRTAIKKQKQSAAKQQIAVSVLSFVLSLARGDATSRVEVGGIVVLPQVIHNDTA